jgi:phosphohistidine phosphatase
MEPIRGTLMLMRHATAAESGPDGDESRPLSARGRREAEGIAEFLAAERLVPDLVLCSSALRTRQTLGIVRGRFPRAPQIDIETSLYLASPRQILDELAGRDREASVLILGHNPGIGVLALELARRGAPAQVAKIGRGFPAGSVAVFEAEFSQWSDFSAGEATLRSFYTPLDL